MGISEWQYSDGRVERLPDSLDKMMEADPAYTRVGTKKAAKAAETKKENG